MQYSNMQNQYNNGSNDNKNTSYTPLDAYRQQKHALQQQIAQVEALEKEMLRQEMLEQQEIVQLQRLLQDAFSRVQKLQNRTVETPSMHFGGYENSSAQTHLMHLAAMAGSQNSACMAEPMVHFKRGQDFAGHPHANLYDTMFNSQIPPPKRDVGPEPVDAPAASST